MSRQCGSVTVKKKHRAETALLRLHAGVRLCFRRAASFSFIIKLNAYLRFVESGEVLILATWLNPMWVLLAGLPSAISDCCKRRDYQSPAALASSGGRTF
jgi:hypothetical protein